MIDDAAKLQQISETENKKRKNSIAPQAYRYATTRGVQPYARDTCLALLVVSPPSTTESSRNMIEGECFTQGVYFRTQMLFIARWVFLLHAYVFGTQSRREFAYLK